MATTAPAGGANPLAEIGELMSGVAGAMSGAASAVTDLVSQLSGFVQALSPGTIEQFGRALKDLQATVGVAFLPIFQILTGAFREVAGIILPIMESLRPVVEQLTNTMMANLMPQIKALADAFTALMPVLEIVSLLVEMFGAMLRPVMALIQVNFILLGFALRLVMVALTPLIAVINIISGVMDGLSQVVNVVAIIFRTLVDMLGAFLKGLTGGLSIKGIMDEVNKVLKFVITNLLVFAATIMKFFGISLQPLIDNLKPKSGATAAESPQFKSFESIGKDLALAAAASQGGGESKKTTEDLLGGAIKTLEGMQKGSEDGFKDVTKTLEAIRGFVEKLANAKETIDKGVTYAKEGASAGAAYAGGGLIGLGIYGARKALGG